MATTDGLLSVLRDLERQTPDLRQENQALLRSLGDVNRANAELIEESVQRAKARRLNPGAGLEAGQRSLARENEILQKENAQLRSLLARMPGSPGGAPGLVPDLVGALLQRASWAFSDEEFADLQVDLALACADDSEDCPE
jgi:hypothetical protein